MLARCKIALSELIKLSAKDNRFKHDD